MALDLERLLAPIPGEQPSGVNLKHDKLYEDIRATRRSIDRKRDRDPSEKAESIQPELDLIIDRTIRAISSQSKDLQLAVWFLEAAMQSEGFAGLTEGVRLVHGLLDKYWENAYPPIETDDPQPLELRASVVALIDTRAPFLLALSPLTDHASAYGLLEHQRLQDPKLSNPEVIKANGWPDKAAFNAAMSAASAPFLLGMTALIGECLAEVNALQALADVKFVARQPSSLDPDRLMPFMSFKRLSDALEEAKHLVDGVIRDRGIEPPAPTGSQTTAPSPAPNAEANASQTLSTPASGPTSALSTPPPTPTAATVVASESSRARPAVSSGSGAVTSRDVAISRIAESVQFMVHDNELEPTTYLLSRAVAFGVLYACDDLDTWNWSAPAPEVRERLGSLFARSEWLALIREAEVELARTPKQAWLDVHRYVVIALETLGHNAAAAATRGQLRALLAKHPNLVDVTLEGGTPAANADTRKWLQQMLAAAPAASPQAGASDAKAPQANVVAEAQAMIRGGRVVEGVALLQAPVKDARNGRERFLRQLDLADACAGGGQMAVALPVIDALVAQIERDHLETWEDGETIARAYAVFIRCAQEFEAPELMIRTQKAFGHLCRIDPAGAVAFEQSMNGLRRGRR